VLPYLETDGRIEDPRLEGTFNYHLVMVKLQGCLAVSATRAVSDGASDSEMAAVYVFSIPVMRQLPRSTCGKCHYIKRLVPISANRNPIADVVR
jgi:hypothetical protein